MDEEPNLPAVVADAELAPGRTIIHQHPDGEDIHQLLAFLCLSDRYRNKWSELSRVVESEFDLKVNPSTLRDFITEYVYPQIVLPDGYHKAAVLAAVDDIAVSKNVFEALQQATDVLKDGLTKVGDFVETEKGHVKTGPSHAEAVRMAKDVQNMATKALDELSRVGLAPESKAPAANQTQVKVNVNLKASSGALDRGFIDADWEEKGKGKSS